MRSDVDEPAQALVTDIVPDGKVRAAMNDINASQRLRCVPKPCVSPVALTVSWAALCHVMRAPPHALLSYIKSHLVPIRVIVSQSRPRCKLL